MADLGEDEETVDVEDVVDPEGELSVTRRRIGCP